MTKQTIRVGASANDKTGDTIRAAFVKVNANFTELYTQVSNVSGSVLPSQTGNADKYLKTDGTTLSWATVSGGTTDRLVSGDKELLLINDGDVVGVLFPTQDTTSLGIQGSEIMATPTPGATDYVPLLLSSFNYDVIISPNAQGPRPSWRFEPAGTIDLPIPQGGVFTLTLSSDNFVPRNGKSALTLSGAPWVFHGQISRDANGQASLQLDSGPLPSLTNPGYVTGDAFTFSDQVHHLFGYSLIITLASVVQSGPAGWTANLQASQLPAYPSTFNSNGAIKITSNSHNWTFGTDGRLTFPSGAGFVQGDSGQL